jgi:hypothetical protein
MNETEVLWLDEHRAISLTELVEVSGLREEELLDLVHSGALPSRDAPDGGLAFSARVITMAWRSGCWSACATSSSRSPACARSCPGSEPRLR